MIKGLRITSEVNQTSGATVTDAFIWGQEFAVDRLRSIIQATVLCYFTEQACSDGKAVIGLSDIPQKYVTEVIHSEIDGCLPDLIFNKLKIDLEALGHTVEIVNE